LKVWPHAHWWGRKATQSQSENIRGFWLNAPLAP
jgi:hypothetical protein